MSRAAFVNPSAPFSLSELAHLSGAKIVGHHTDSAEFLVHDLASLSEATVADMTVLHQKKYIKELQHSLAGACIIAPAYINYAPSTMFLLVHDNPYKAFALISQVFYPTEKKERSIAGSAYIAKSAVLGQLCRVEHGAYIGDDVVIGDRCTIGVNAYIGDGVIMGDDCQIENNVSISHTRMGNKVWIYPGARIGQDGFGFASDQQGHYKIPHRGKVLIGNDVEIGANTCVDRGSLKDTVIEDWCRIDNLVQIGHNVKIGRGSIIAGQAGLAGSTELGKFVCLGGQVGVAAHSKVGDRAIVMAQAGVMKDVKPGAKMSGYPAIPAIDWHRQTITLQQLIQKKPLEKC